MKTIPPKKPKLTSEVASTEAVKVRLAKRPRCRIGSLTRVSIHRKRPSITAPSRSRPATDGSVQSLLTLLVRPSMIGTMAAVKAAAPR